MAEQFKQMLVNQGDPITSELLSNIVTNINLLNNMVQAGSGDDTPTVGVAKVIESNRTQVTCNTSNTGKATIKFKKTFSSKPNVVCSIEQSVGSQFTKDKYMPVITAISPTEFTVQMLSLGATANGTIWVQWIAVLP